MGIFIKNNQSDFSDQLHCEAKGIRALSSLESSLKIPTIFAVSNTKLEMEKIDSSPFDEEGWSKLGLGLARLHKNNQSIFGLNYDNYIGLNPQINSELSNWGEFFAQNRLSMQIDFMTNQELQSDLRQVLERNLAKLVELLNAHSPKASPLHGDLWSGNVLYDGEHAWLIDPAFYWGDRECDLAMTKMFGRFGNAFYESYENAFPLPSGHETREVIYNLYHYLNHYNLFGNSYLAPVKEGLELLQKL